METWRTVLSVFAAILVYINLGGDPPRLIEPLNPNDPERLPNGVSKKVLIVGGGLAGLSAGLELAERGYNVTIKEKNHELGGRLMTEEIEVQGETFHIEHGFHGWFNNYHNMKDVRNRLGVNKFFYPWVENYFMYRDYELEEIHSIGPYPINLLLLALRSPNIQILKVICNPQVAWNNWFYDHDTVYEKFDNMTYSKWEEHFGVDKAFSEVLLKPALSASFNEGPVFSAAEMLMFSHLYFMGDAEADRREVTIVDHGTALINPWAERIKQLGGKIEVNSQVNGLQVNPHSGYVIHDEGEPAAHYDHVVLATDLPATQRLLGSLVDGNEDLPPAIMKTFKTLREDVDKIPIAPPYKVIRVWFDKHIKNSPNYNVLQTPQHHPINLIAQYSLLEKEYIDWREKTGGSVFEFHCYTWLKEDVPDDQVWEFIAPTVKEIYPEIIERDFKIVGYHVFSSQNFASFASGLESSRPTSGHPQKLGIPNLSFAGDWLHTDYPSALMERAVSTGREAANHILLSDHVRQVPLKVTGSRGPGII